MKVAWRFHSGRRHFTLTAIKRHHLNQTPVIQMTKASRLARVGQEYRNASLSDKTRFEAPYNYLQSDLGGFEFPKRTLIQPGESEYFQSRGCGKNP